MTIWRPELPAASTQPIYVDLAQAIADAVAEGRLAAGERLPTQRALASELGIALATVTRAFAEAERRGLISSEVGRGTFVRSVAVANETQVADLRPNVLRPAPFERELRESTARAVRDGGVDLFDYGPHAGRARHREAGARLFGELGLETPVERVLVTSGVQHAMAIVFGTLLGRGDALLVEERTYSGIRPLADFLGIRLVPVAIDGEGMAPDALAAAAKRSGARAVYAMAVLQNPSGAVMSAKRVEAIARVVERQRLTLIEDDTYGFLLPAAPRLSPHVPEAYTFVGASKSLVPALRIGWARAPRAAMAKLESAIAGTIYLASPLTAELATHWIASGLWERVAAWKREEARARQAIARAALGRFGYAPDPASLHGWLELPAGWTSAQLVTAAAERGVLLSPGESFSVAPLARPAVRIVVGSTPSREALAAALATVAELVDRGVPMLGAIA